jgi:septum formation inhibitor-activating ATPase MinD
MIKHWIITGDTHGGMSTITRVGNIQRNMPDYKPEDTGIITSTNKGDPIVNNEEALAGKAYRNVAQRILGEEVPFLDLDEPKGFVAKIKNVFAKLKAKV